MSLILELRKPEYEVQGQPGLHINSWPQNTRGSTALRRVLASLGHHWTEQSHLTGCMALQSHLLLQTALQRHCLPMVYNSLQWVGWSDATCILMLQLVH